jgi:nucleoside-diphosphate-sugar epimerase
MRGGKELNIEIDEGRLRPYDVDRLLCDSSKLRRLTGWRPRTKFYDGLVETVDFFHKNGDKWDYRVMAP